MNNKKNDHQSPMSEYLLKLQLIVSNTEFKNKEEADKYETLESNMKGRDYIRACNHTDIFESYNYPENYVYDTLINAGFDNKTANKLIQNPHMIPQGIKSVMMEQARYEFLKNYKETNRYYLMLTGKPFMGDKDELAEKIHLIPIEFYEVYKDENVIEKDMAIHEMPLKYQELFMGTSYYKKLLEQYPESRYLKYLGSNAIPIESSRAAHDGDIMKINTTKLTTYHPVYGTVTVSPDIIHKFVSVYQETRTYVYEALTGDFSSIYPNYNSFVRFLTIYMAIGSSLNEFMKNSSSLLTMSNASANNLFMLYGLPSVIMEGQSMIDFLKKFRLLLMDKGTNTVYRVKDLVGYEYTDIYTLIMVKQQVFENGVPVYVYKDGKAIPKQRIVFRRLGTTDDNTSYFNFRESRKEYLERRFPEESSHSEEYQISSGDPRWWNTREVDEMLENMNYTLSNSKYIQLSTHLSMTDVWFQTVILLRGLMDNRLETQYSLININYNINGSSEISIFEAVLSLLILMNWQLGFEGNMYLQDGKVNGKLVCLDLLFNGMGDGGVPYPLKTGNPFKIASFDFDVKTNKPEFYNSLSDMDYLEPERFISMLDSVLNRETINTGEVIMKDIKLIFDYLESKLRYAKTIHEFRQVSDAYNNLFLVDPVRNWYDSSIEDSDTLICNEFNISDNELTSLKIFFPRTVPNGGEILVKYKDVDYYISLYQVLNSDVKSIKKNGIYPFMENGFIKLFENALRDYTSAQMISSTLSNNIKENWKNIIIDKAAYDINNIDGGPKTFAALLHRTNASLYKFLIDLRNNGNGNDIVLLMRAIIKSLESYVSTSLAGLEFKALGMDNYIFILKEIISYFKSYMVEFTKDEFTYLFNGILDNGGNPNMLHLYDEITHMTMVLKPQDSLTLFDAGKFSLRQIFDDGNDEGIFYDQALFRMKAKYKYLKDTGYDLWYDNGKNISKTPLPNLTDDTLIIANIIKPKGSVAYKIIIPNTNINPDTYYGNKRKIK